ncbi:hypothetical protein M1466_01860 [Candidatus Dependentiae bacterium]|nr:hypothetical protein [Candidatus Dependentiae bacterium]
MKLFSYSEALKESIKLFSQLSEVYDLLLRGTAITEEQLTEEWSDIDFSIIFNKITPSALNSVRHHYQYLSKKYPFKISVTLMSKEDYLSSCHYHGIKPLYYQKLLSSSRSIFKKDISCTSAVEEQFLRFDCYANVAYLMHELRSSFLKLDIQKDSQLRLFTLHLLRRTKHLIRNSIFIKTGYIDEEIDSILFSELFPEIDPNLIQTFCSAKTSWNSGQTNKSLEQIVEKTFLLAEQVYENLVLSRCFVNQRKS